MSKWTQCLFLSMIMAVGTTARAENPSTFHVDVKGQGSPMILIPGLASSGDVWDSTVAHYAGQYRCYVLTVAGFAGQPPVKGFSLDRVTDDLSHYIAAQNLPRPVIVGHSLGGFLALKLASEHPSQVGKLVIVDSLPALGAVMDPKLTPARLKANAEKMRAGMESMTEDQRLKMGRSAVEGMATKPSDVERIYGWTKTTDGHTEAVAMSDLMGADLRNDIANITAPTLVLGTWIEYKMYATESEVRHNFELQYKNLKGVEIEMAPNARHFIMYDNPQWMFQQTDRFLSNSRATK